MGWQAGKPGGGDPPSSPPPPAGPPARRGWRAGQVAGAAGWGAGHVTHMLKPGTPAGAPSPPRRQDYKAAAFPPSASSRPGSSRAPAGEEGTVRRTLDGFALAARSARTPLDGDPPATMKLWVALAVLALVLAQALADELGDNDQLGYFADWSDGDQDKEELPFPFEHLLQRIARRPRPQQFYGLMGKRDAGYGPLSHKRHKTDSFVGLMGKRSLNSGSSEWNTAQIYERRRK